MFQQEQPKPTRGKGRPKETLKDKMIDDANGDNLQQMHSKMNGKKGKTKALKALLAQMLKEQIGIQNYKPFEIIWRESGLAKQRYNSKEYIGKVRGEDEILKLFK